MDDFDPVLVAIRIHIEKLEAISQQVKSFDFKTSESWDRERILGSMDGAIHGVENLKFLFIEIYDRMEEAEENETGNH